MEGQEYPDADPLSNYFPKAEPHVSFGTNLLKHP
jgi:hypothetical protein